MESTIVDALSSAFYDVSRFPSSMVSSLDLRSKVVLYSRSCCIGLLFFLDLVPLELCPVERKHMQNKIFFYKSFSCGKKAN